MRAVQHKSFYMYKYEDDIIGSQCYDAPAMSFPIAKPRIIRFRGRTLIDGVPARRSSKDMRHPTAQAQDKRRFGGASVFFGSPSNHPTPPRETPKKN